MTRRVTRLTTEVAQQPDALTRVTRVAIEVAQQPGGLTRTTRLMAEVAVGFVEDLDLGGRRSLVLHHHRLSELPTRTLA